MTHQRVQNFPTLHHTKKQFPASSINVKFYYAASTLIQKHRWVMETKQRCGYQVSMWIWYVNFRIKVDPRNCVLSTTKSGRRFWKKMLISTMGTSVLFLKRVRQPNESLKKFASDFRRQRRSEAWNKNNAGGGLLPLLVSLNLFYMHWTKSGGGFKKSLLTDWTNSQS